MSEQQAWHKSSYSGQHNNCVEVSLPHWRSSSHNGGCVKVPALPGSAAVRDSKHPDTAVLAFPAAEWSAFIHSLNREEFEG